MKNHVSSVKMAPHLEAAIKPSATISFSTSLSAFNGKTAGPFLTYNGNSHQRGVPWPNSRGEISEKMAAISWLAANPDAVVLPKPGTLHQQQLQRTPSGTAANHKTVDGAAVQSTSTTKSAHLQGRSLNVNVINNNGGATTRNRADLQSTTSLEQAAPSSNSSTNNNNNDQQTDLQPKLYRQSSTIVYPVSSTTNGNYSASSLSTAGSISSTSSTLKSSAGFNVRKSLDVPQSASSSSSSSFLSLPSNSNNKQQQTIAAASNASQQAAAAAGDERKDAAVELRRRKSEIGFSTKWSPRREASNVSAKSATAASFKLPPGQSAAAASASTSTTTESKIITQLLKTPIAGVDPPTLGRGPHVSQAICKVKDPSGVDCYGFLCALPVQTAPDQIVYGLMTLKTMATAGLAKINCLKSWNLLVHFESSFRPEKPLDIPFKKCIVSKKFGVSFFELPKEATEYIQFKRLEFLYVFPGKTVERQRIMALQNTNGGGLGNKQPQCIVGEVVQAAGDGYFKHKISSLPGLPILDPITFTVVGVQKGADFNGNELAVSVKAAVDEMAPEDANNWLNFVATQDSPTSAADSSPNKPSNDAKSNENNTSKPNIDLHAPLIRNLSNRAKKDQNFNLIRQSKLIPDALKDEICEVVQKYYMTADELAVKSESDIRLLYPRRDVQEAVFTWKRSIQIDCWRREKLPIEAGRLHKFVRKGDLPAIKSILFDKNVPPGCRPLLVEHKDANNYKNTALIQATLIGNPGIVQFMLRECNANVYARDGHELESMPIHLAAAYGYLEIVAMLADAKPDLVEAKNRNNDTPLNRAAARGRLMVTQYLVDKKFANLENRGEYGRTPLMMAAAWGHLPIVEYLTDRGADATLKDSETFATAVHLAAYFGQASIASFLISRFPDLATAKNRFGRTPWAVAKAQQKKNVMMVLENRGANIDQ